MRLKEVHICIDKFSFSLCPEKHFQPIWFTISGNEKSSYSLLADMCSWICSSMISVKALPMVFLHIASVRSSWAIWTSTSIGYMGLDASAILLGLLVSYSKDLSANFYPYGLDLRVWFNKLVYLNLFYLLMQLFFRYSPNLFAVWTVKSVAWQACHLLGINV